MLNNAKAEFSTREHIERLTKALENQPELDTKATEAGIPIAWLHLIAETEEEMRKHAHPEKMQEQWYMAQKEMKKTLRRLYSGLDEKSIRARWEEGYFWDRVATRMWSVAAMFCGVFTGTWFAMREKGDMAPDIWVLALFVMIAIICVYAGRELEKRIVDREKEKTEKEILSVMQTSG